MLAITAHEARAMAEGTMQNAAFIKQIKQTTRRINCRIREAAADGELSCQLHYETTHDYIADLPERAQSHVLSQVFGGLSAQGFNIAHDEDWTYIRW